MAASKHTRIADFSDDEDNNRGGRSTVATADVDAEIDGLSTVADDHADKLDILLRDDLKVQDNLLEGHEFSSAAVTLLASMIGTNTALVWRGSYSTANVYAVGNLVQDSGSAYISLKAQTAGQYANFAAALADSAWELFAQSASTTLPGGSAADDILYASSPGVFGWTKLTAAMAPLFALKASPAFTGLMSLVAVKTGRVDHVTGSAITLNFEAGPNQSLSPLSNNVTFSTSNLAAAAGEVKMIDLHVVADSSGPYTLVFPATWRWVGSQPATIAASKVGVLSLRCYGATDADVVAAWAVEA